MPSLVQVQPSRMGRALMGNEAQTTHTIGDHMAAELEDKMTVYELNREQLNQLKTAYFWGDETQDSIPDNIISPDQIPDDIIFHHYADIYFESEDFFNDFVDNIPMELPF